MSLEQYFSQFRNNIIGNGQEFETPFGNKKICYADWTASGRLYQPIEDLITNKIAPFVGNTHTETTVTGSSMTIAYHKSKEIIKEHVGANDHDVLISSNSGMTGVVNKFQRILGLKVHEKFKDAIHIPKEDRPIVFVTHMEHHSNQTSWLETICDVAIINACPEGKVCLDHFQKLLEQYADRKHKIAAVTSCSNVTGIMTPYHKIASMVHKAGGLCFVDFACSAPYIEINMHPEDESEKLDAIYFSPHKFLGGPSSSGILIFCKSLYNNQVPDVPGGGTVDWTNPRGGHKYYDSIEAREDGGTPGFLQTIRVALCVKLKEEMGVDKMMAREEEIIDRVWKGLEGTENVRILADNIKHRLCVVSFYIDDLHYNLAVKLLNDRFGIQVRGGCSCAGTYGHYLLQVSQDKSKSITDSISCGILGEKPGWIRMSFHPVMTNEQIDHVIAGVKELAMMHADWKHDYDYNESTNEWQYKNGNDVPHEIVEEWFAESLC